MVKHIPGRSICTLSIPKLCSQSPLSVNFLQSFSHLQRICRLPPFCAQEVNPSLRLFSMEKHMPGCSSICTNQSLVQLNIHLMQMNPSLIVLPHERKTTCIPSRNPIPSLFPNLIGMPLTPIRKRLAPIRSLRVTKQGSNLTFGEPRKHGCHGC
jgi:hypothetical protein